MTIHLALSHFETGEYETTRGLLRDVLKDGAGRRTVEARIRLARASVRLGDTESADADLAVAERELDKSPNSGMQVLLKLVRGELAHERNRRQEARANFEQAAALWIETLPQAATVEARAYLVMLGAQDGTPDPGRACPRHFGASEKLGQIAIEVRCRLALARIEIAAHLLDEAEALLEAIPPDDETRTIGWELRAGDAHRRARIQKAWWRTWPPWRWVGSRHHPPLPSVGSCREASRDFVPRGVTVMQR